MHIHCTLTNGSPLWLLIVAFDSSSRRFCHICVEFVSDLCRVCVGFVSSLCRIYIEFVSNLCRIRVDFVSNLSHVCRICVEFVSDLYQFVSIYIYLRLVGHISVKKSDL